MRLSKPLGAPQMLWEDWYPLAGKNKRFGSKERGGSDGTRTRGLRRDRPAF